MFTIFSSFSLSIVSTEWSAVGPTLLLLLTSKRSFQIQCDVHTHTFLHTYFGYLTFITGETIL